MSPPSGAELHAQTDEELRLLIVQADARWRDAYEALFLHRYAGLIISAKAAVEKRYRLGLATEEVFGELFLHLCGRSQAWKNLKSWDPGRPFSTWLWVVVKNLCGRLAKKERNYAANLSEPTAHSRDEGTDVVPQERPDPRPPVDEVVGLNRLLQQIGEECAQILRFKYYHDMTDTEIAKRLNIGREWANRQRRKCVARMAGLVQSQGLRRSDFSVFDTA